MLLQNLVASFLFLELNIHFFEYLGVRRGFVGSFKPLR